MTFTEAMTESCEIAVSDSNAFENYTIQGVVYGHDHIGIIMKSNIQPHLVNLWVPYFRNLFPSRSSIINLCRSIFKIAHIAVLRDTYIPISANLTFGGSLSAS